MLFLATFFEATCTLLYGFLEKIHNYKLLVFVIFLLRGLHGVGSAIIITLVYSLTYSLSDPKNVQSSLGYIEIAWSSGIAIGPLFASFFYHLGGYPLTFYILGCFLYFSVYLTKKLQNELQDFTNKNQDDNNNINITENNDINNIQEDSSITPSVLGYVTKYKVVILLLSSVSSFIANTFYFPSLTNHLMNK